jgi:Fe-S cluster assembly protein SufD
MTNLALPTRRDEAFRYSDVDALAGVWPVAAERIVVSAGETLVREIVNVADAEDVVVRNLEIALEPNAKAVVRVLNAGGRLGRISLDVTCGEGSDFDLGAVQLGSGKQTVEIVTTVRHTGLNATSRQVVRSIVSGGAVCTYLGKVDVARGADGTDSAQDVKAMLLDRLSTAMALYYLQSRGLPPAEAKRLLLQAFVASVFDGDERLQALAVEKLGDLV